ncbi:transcription-repair coupling factor [Spirulina sp. CCNP1310]|uniref:transcription-repair coupling factor n=1 Tax=Spirulina sp. CCNP1310 TaxID=3110249 RepID=UPI002B1F6773|nr:transcription-repair coupling factor [Spirulina sp. CCNP1310]MEA5419382.1 transcription-repair coupling factor [Spirulina sp. CCNP1310]
MALSSVVRSLSRSPLTQDFIQKLNHAAPLHLTGVARLPKGLVSSAIAQQLERPLLVVCPTLEEAGRWAAQLEVMGWEPVRFYPTSEASPYEALEPESEMVWGQLAILSEQVRNPDFKGAIVTTERGLQPHLPPPDALGTQLRELRTGMTIAPQDLDRHLASLGYERVALVESEGQWSRRGDLVDIFPVSTELPLRLEWYGDDIERMREFDPATQRSLDTIQTCLLTPTSFTPLLAAALQDCAELSETEQAALAAGEWPAGLRRYLGLAYPEPANLLHYLPAHTLVVIDEPEQCRAHCSRWVEYVTVQWQAQPSLPPLHQDFATIQSAITTEFTTVLLSELVIEGQGINLSSRPIPTTPHQFPKLAEILRGQREVSSGLNLQNYHQWLISAQPSRTVSLLQEHDCNAQFIPNPKDYPAIERSHQQHCAVGLKYSGLAELEGFILPTYRIVVVTDREFFGQHSLASPTYIRKRRRAASKQVDLNKLSPGNYVVHRNHGIGKFLQLETLEGRDYLAIKYDDGILRVPADSVDSLSRFQQTGKRPPELNKMAGKTWERTKARVQKAIQKVAVDLLALYAKRSQQTGFAYPPDEPWQAELEDSFPYQPTPDQLKATQDVKRDLESDRPMDRLVCGDVGFGKTEVAIRAIFKAITAGNKQVAFLAPTTILTQQHYHTLKERFAPYPIQIGLLNRFRTASERKELLQRLKTGELDVIVGTQQILGKGVEFRDLGLLVIDEEQRFGVNQKEKIKALKTQVDVLTLTATPIPRTLYMSLSGIREMSLITTPPPSRRPIQTHLSPYNPDVIRTAIRNELDRGGQVFYVVPRVEGIETVSAQLETMLPSARVAIAHGQMEEGELETTMLAFNNGEADILVCTTIVESGLDIPRVNTIIIEDAQRFGLSQLYQLRGRVGRSGVQAHAWLLYPATQSLSEPAQKRLRAIQEFTQLGSGYQLATRDMEIRGVGNILGAEQSGQMLEIGFDLYMSMLQEALQEVRGQEIPKVEDTQIDLKLTAFIPADYIPDLEQKMAAYRAVSSSLSERELLQIEEAWGDRYGSIPQPALQLIQVVKLKQIAKSLGFSRIKPDGPQHIVLETPMEEPAWRLLIEHLPQHLRSRFVYAPKKVTVRGLGVLKPEQQLSNLIDWLGTIQAGLLAR